MLIRRLLPFAMALGLTTPTDGLLSIVASPQVVAQSLLQLKLRRSGERVDVVIEGLSTDARVVSQRSSPSQWIGQLRAAGPLSLRRSQQVELPAVGLESIRLSASAKGGLELVVKATQGMALPEPQIRMDGTSLIVSLEGLSVQTTALPSGKLDLRRPGRLAQPKVVPPMRPRAVAPPLGDMAVGTMILQNRSYVNLSGPPVTLVLNDSPAKSALMSLTRLGGYGLVYMGDDGDANALTKITLGEKKESPRPSRLITMSFKNESYARVLNAILLASGLQAKLDGQTLMVGPNILDKTFGPKVSKVYRLNQSSAFSAANYLGGLGAEVNRIATSSVTSSSETGFDGASSKTTTETKGDSVKVEAYGASVGPLKGLFVTTDSRLQTVTLIGDSSLIAIAEKYLRQLDLRQRQVALSVKILDVNLANGGVVDNSFAFRYGNNFIVSDRGELVGAFGALLPPNNGSFDTIAGGASSGKNQYSSDNLTASPPLDPVPINPGTLYGTNTFYDIFRALIVSSNTKTLASPTLILGENPGKLRGREVAVMNSVDAFSKSSIGRPYANEGFIAVGTQVTTNYEVTPGQNGAPNSCQPEESTAGLTFGARVSKIDDNGFVTFSLSPSISAVTGTELIQGCGTRSVLSVRRLDTGSLRVRDGQTLVLTGVISDVDTEAVRKWPILGDIPLIGQFFRQSSNSKEKRELVILVTPRIIDDALGDNYGYGYSPSIPAARQVMGGS